jgi:folate-dependent tRNA-U54 methylase TrmFO/GidA
MKKIILLFTAVTFVMSSVTARAQLQNSEAESVFNTLEVAYSPTTMNVNFGIIAPPEKRIRGGKAAKNKYLSARSLAELDQQFLTF